MTEHKPAIGDMLRSLTLRVEGLQSELASLRQDVKRLLFMTEEFRKASGQDRDTADDRQHE